jgi:hypothetical protein
MRHHHQIDRDAQVAKCLSEPRGLGAATLEFGLDHVEVEIAVRPSVASVVRAEKNHLGNPVPPSRVGGSPR